MTALSRIRVLELARSSESGQNPTFAARAHYDHPTEMEDTEPNHGIVVDCAAASDGGSLFLQLPVGGRTLNFVLNRSIASRGTTHYDEIRGEQGPLSKEELHDLMREIDRPQDGPCVEVVREFVKVLKRSVP